MATHMRCRANTVISKLLRCSKIRAPCASKRWQRCVSSHTDSEGGRDPGPVFIQPAVQDILYRITGFDLDKIFSERPAKNLQPAKYQLLTDAQLEELQKKAVERGVARLQMPPVMRARRDVEDVLVNDAELDGYDNVNYVFTDISVGLSNHSRVVVVREPSGKLRTGSSEERDRMLQLYFPPDGRMSRMPQLFQEQHLERILERADYEYVLDRACVQFEPDNPHYLRVVHRVYEHVAGKNEYDLLRSTRHFGGMAFYFVTYRKIEGLLVDMIQRDLLTDAADLVRLYVILHPDCKSAQLLSQQTTDDPHTLIQMFVDQDAQHGGAVELALQTYRESSQLSSAAAQSQQSTG